MRKLVLILALLLTPTLLSAQSITTTTCPGAGCQDYNVGGNGSVGIQVTGTWVGTITFQASIDGSTFTSIRVVLASDTNATGISTTTANGIFNGAVAGYSKVRIVFTAFTSGTAILSFRSTNAGVNFLAGGSGGGSGTVESVAMTVPSALLTVTGSPITTTGTFDITLGTRAANLVFAGPTNGAAATPAFRSLVAADIPDISATYATASNAMAFTNKTGNISQWTNNSGYLTAITGGTCTNQSVTAISTGGVPTCTSITSAYVSGTTGSGNFVLATSPIVSAITVSSLTAGRISFAGTAGLLSDEAALTWNTTNKALRITEPGALPVTTGTDYTQFLLTVSNIATYYPFVILNTSFSQSVEGGLILYQANDGTANITSGGAINFGSSGVIGFSGTTNAFTGLITASHTFTDLTTAAVTHSTLSTILTPAANATQNATGVAFGTTTTGGNIRNFQLIIGADGSVAHNGSGTVVAIYTDRQLAQSNSSGTVSDAVAQYGIVRNIANGTLTNARTHYGYVENTSTGTITEGSIFWAGLPVNSGGGTFTNYYAGYTVNLLPVTTITNKYFLWNDSGVGSDCNSGGVWRNNDFGITAYYNPCFAKYTPGLANFERIRSRWGDTGVEGLDNRALLGTEEGGTGVERPLDLTAANVSFKSATLSPAVSNTSADSCGTTAASIAGNDNVWKITVGATAGTSCTVTFATAFINAPSCSVSNETTANLSRATSTTTTAILAGTFVAGDVLAGICIGR